MDVEHIKDTFLVEDRLEYFERLKKDVPWQQMKWGRGNLPRLIFKCEPFTNSSVKVLDELAQICEDSFEARVVSIWCNYYRNGNDWTPPHQDRYGNYVVTYSFGETRKFVTTLLDGSERTEYMLSDGDIFCFSPAFDIKHKHSIPKTTKYTKERFSIVMFIDPPGSQTHWKREGQPRGSVVSDDTDDSGESDDLFITDFSDGNFTIEGNKIIFWRF
jgi:hypothetical protein